MILKKIMEGRSRSDRLPFFGFVFFRTGNRSSRGCGNVGIRRVWRDSQGAEGTGGNPPLVFRSFLNSVISTALCPDSDPCYRILGALGDSILQARNILSFAAPIRRANSVSLISAAFRSRASMLIPGFSFVSTPGSILSFWCGVA